MRFYELRSRFRSSIGEGRKVAKKHTPFGPLISSQTISGSYTYTAHWLSNISGNNKQK